MCGLLSPAALAVLSLLADAPLPSQAPRVFPAEVGLVAVEVRVVDAEGRPVPDLAPAEFRVEVGGRPRRVATAEFVPVTGEPEGSRPGEPDPGFTTNGAPPERLVLLVVDTANIELHSGRETMLAASRVLDRLGPRDQVGLVTIPSSGPREEFTTDRERIRKALRQVVGRGVLTGGRISLSQSFGLEKRRRALGPAQGRAGGADVTAAASMRETEDWTTSMELENVSSRSRSMIEAAFDALRPLPGQKVLVLVSQGLGFPQTLEHPGAGGAELRRLVHAAIAARVAFYVVPVIPRSPLPSIDSDIDATTLSLDRQMLASGLEALAVDSGGVLLRDEPERAFERVLRETSGYYRLGFEPQGDDRDGKARKIRVSVTRKGLVVRARPSVVFRHPEGEQAAKDELVAALRSPTLATDLPLRVTTWSLPGGEPGQVKLLIGAEIDRAAEPGGLGVGYVLLDAEGRVAASASQQMRPDAQASGPIPYLTSASVVPGVYTLRLAVRDGRGRLGSVARSLEAGLLQLGPLALSDLLLGEPPAPGAGFRPAVAPEAKGATRLLVRAELSGGEEALATAAASGELVSAETGASLRVVPVRLAPADAPGRRVLEALLPLQGLAPGAYLARVVVIEGGIPRGAAVRPFRVVGP